MPDKNGDDGLFVKSENAVCVLAEDAFHCAASPTSQPRLARYLARRKEIFSNHAPSGLVAAVGLEPTT
jgi:hypothetical protein